MQMADSLSLPRFGLYYPYINFRDEGWAKVAALYWPKMARIVPSGYPVRNLPAIQALIDALDWVVDVPPEEARSHVAPTFETLLAKLGHTAAEWWPGAQYEAKPGLDAITAPSWGSGPGQWPKSGKGNHNPAGGMREDDRVAGIHTTEFDPALLRALVRLHFATPIDPGLLDAEEGWAALPSGVPNTFDERWYLTVAWRNPDWVVMHRDLVWIYKCLLSETLASRNRLTLTTDQVGAHAAASGLTASQLALGGVAGQEVEAELATNFGLTAVRTVVPKDLASVPIEKIIEVRRRFGGQFDAWRDYIDAVGAELAEQLKDVESPQVLHQYLDEAARRYAEAPVDQLRQGLSSVCVDAAEAVLNTKFETPAALAAVGLATGNPVGVAAGAAVGIAQLRRSTAKNARAKLASPSAYLLTVREHLQPRSWVKRVREVMKAAAGLRG
jgi:hypothetical protein